MRLIFFLFLVTMALGATANADNCASRDWVNAFNPSATVCVKSTDPIETDLNKPLFTREGTLACSNSDNFSMAYNAMLSGWVYVTSAGIRGPPGMRDGQQK
jgi:hypothetical protein